MERIALEKEIFTYVAKSYKKNVDEISCDTKFHVDLADNSMMQVALTSLIEEELDVSIDFLDLSQYATVGELVDRVESELA